MLFRTNADRVPIGGCDPLFFDLWVFFGLWVAVFRSLDMLEGEEQKNS